MLIKSTRFPAYQELVILNNFCCPIGEKSAHIICFGKKSLQKYAELKLIFSFCCFPLNCIRFSNKSNCSSIFLNNCAGAESLSQLIFINKQKGLLNFSARSNMSLFPVNGGLLIIISQFFGSYL